jgi:CIC family chloride channel protein
LLFTNTKKRNSHANAALTGIILVTEMTDNSRLLLPVLAACFSAMAVATMLREPPIYDALKERTLALWRKSRVDLAAA